MAHKQSSGVDLSIPRVRHLRYAVGAVLVLVMETLSLAQEIPRVSGVELQPLATQASTLIDTLDYLGAPLAARDKQALRIALRAKAAAEGIGEIQRVLDKYCLLDVHINPESRVRVAQGPAIPELVEHGWRTFLVKVRNEAGVTAHLNVQSPNALPVFVRSSDRPSPKASLSPQDVRNRWLDLSLYSKPPLNPRLSGLEVEYAVIQLYSRDAGKRAARLSFNVGQGSQDIGFRNEVNVLFTSRPSIDVTLRVEDERGRPATASFIIRDKQGHIYPSPAKRLAPDFAFHPQIYRTDGETIRLPAGDYEIEFSRGPEYLVLHQSARVGAGAPPVLTFRLERWIDAAKLGWYSGDHHIHAAGCKHYESPTEGVLPQDMIRQILGEALNVGAVLTWGPSYYYQKQFFEGTVNRLSTGENLMRYDLEVSGFPSSHNGHVVLLGLKQQDYPGAQTLDGWPTWNLPILEWARSQGAVVGYAHSGGGLAVKTDRLPNYEMPGFDGVGANEYVVDVTHHAVDFISAVDTPYVWELNIWYHTLNTGFRTRIAGETDFPCLYGERVGIGRSYVQLDGKLDFDPWVRGLRDGRSYVSDGKGHLMDFRANGVLVGTAGSELQLASPERVSVTAMVAARLDETPDEAIRRRPYDEQPWWSIERARIDATREVPVELIVNGLPVATKTIVADGTMRKLDFEVPIERSSWLAIRILPSAHTNPIFVTVRGKPVRASRQSASWLLKAVDQCWSQKFGKISVGERPAAAAAYERARQTYRQIVAESEID